MICIANHLTDFLWWGTLVVNGSKRDSKACQIKLDISKQNIKRVSLARILLNFNNFRIVSSVFVHFPILNLLRKSMDWFLYDNGLRLESVNRHVSSDTHLLRMHDLDYRIYVGTFQYLVYSITRVGDGFKSAGTYPYKTY